MIEESRMMASDCRWEMGGGATGMSCLIRLVWRERKKKVSRHGVERRMTDRVGGIIWMVGYVRDRPVSGVHQADYTQVVLLTVLGVVAGLSFVLNKGYRAKPTYCILDALSRFS